MKMQYMGDGIRMGDTGIDCERIGVIQHADTPFGRLHYQTLRIKSLYRVWRLLFRVSGMLCFQRWASECIVSDVWMDCDCPGDGSSMSKDTREDRAIARFACPTCKVRAGEKCVDREGRLLRSVHGPGIHPLRRKLLSVANAETRKEWG